MEDSGGEGRGGEWRGGEGGEDETHVNDFMPHTVYTSP